ncbi:Pfs, NACHT and Ankyrin domain protein [Phytophthora megakarya]|uniref:Pfs, NACHT and Ankyrin domain protein n=1 Tax=Phytophthora megakarya TaxID=4795 RepID=A0A225UQ47_9STRA|nr:Pfs, NACHT and Ankyrin domain protein [Phytophthora megakarya]
MTWECFVCWKTNGVGDERCICCGRSRNFIPRSAIINSQAKPLVLHGLAAAQHTFHPALIHSLQEAGLDLLGGLLYQSSPMIGDVTAVRCILQGNIGKNASILEATRSGGWRALHLATRGGHCGVVEELLLANVNMNAQLENSDDALTPLHIAAKQGYADILDLLLQCGADPTLVTHHLSRSPLHFAVSAAQERCVRLLLAKPNLFGLRDREGLTALHLASLLPPSGGKPNPIQREIIVLLEAHQPYGSAPPTLMNTVLEDGLTALHLASLLPPSGGKPNPIQREIIALLEAHQPYGSAPPIIMNTVLE